MHVPDLGAKIAHLLRFGPLHRKPELAHELGVTISTLNGWINGSAKSPREWVPDARWPALVAQFGRALPESIALDDAERLLLGEAAALERALRSDTHPILEDVLTSEGQIGTSRLLHCPTLSLVELVEDEDPEVPSIRLRQPFMVEVDAKRGGYILALNNAGQLWGAIRFADGCVSPKIAPGQILIPGIRSFKFSCIREPSVTGPHRIVMFISPQPFPGAVLDAPRSGAALDWSIMEDLAAYITAIPRHLREVHVLKFKVTDAG